MKSIHPFKSYWTETKSVTTTPTTTPTTPPPTPLPTDNMIPMCLPCYEYAGDTKTYLPIREPNELQSGCEFPRILRGDSILCVNSASLAIQNAPSEDSDQTGRMRRLIWIFIWRICPKVGFLPCGLCNRERERERERERTVLKGFILSALLKRKPVKRTGIKISSHYQTFVSFNDVRIRCISIICLITDKRLKPTKPSILSINCRRVEAH